MLPPLKMAARCVAGVMLALQVLGCHTMHPNNPPASQPAAGRVRSIGGVFFKCKDPAAMKHWYAAHLGLQTDAYGTNFEWRQADDPTRKGFTQWSPFSDKTTYFQPSSKDFMINYRVENLDDLVAHLRRQGVQIVDEIKVEPYGKFCHIMDPEGNAIELWEPNDAEYDKIVEARTK